MSAELTARVAELASLIERHAAEDERTALATGTDAAGLSWSAPDLSDPDNWAAGLAVVDDNGDAVVYAEGLPTAAQTDHIARNDPERALRRAKAARELTVEILTERHEYVDGDPWFSCSQATEPGGEGEPGSACADDERRGKPCDCGRDARVARLLGIIASEWED